MMFAELLLAAAMAATPAPETAHPVRLGALTMTAQCFEAQSLADQLRREGRDVAWILRDEAGAMGTLVLWRDAAGDGVLVSLPGGDLAHVACLLAVGPQQ